jgi:hypothetical protein
LSRIAPSTAARLALMKSMLSIGRGSAIKRLARQPSRHREERGDAAIRL